jgi:hypothetical protein
MVDGMVDGTIIDGRLNGWSCGGGRLAGRFLRPFSGSVSGVGGAAALSFHAGIDVTRSASTRCSSAENNKH